MKLDWTAKLRHFLQVLAFCLAIAAIQYAFMPERPYEMALVYSLGIGVATWALIDFGRHLFASSLETGWPQCLAETRQHANEARLKLLETQLEPHMLFNTLANLRALISTDPQRASDMLDRMIAYLRATLDASRATTHPLQAEFDRLRDYLELMAVRMGPRLRYTLDLPPDLARLPVPALLLQPLVENSIRHGLEPKLDGGSITVRARREGQLLTLEVSDSGVGLTDAPASGAGFGLAQMRERLVATYGPHVAINFIAGTAGGTRASITISSQT